MEELVSYLNKTNPFVSPFDEETRDEDDPGPGPAETVDAPVADEEPAEAVAETVGDE